MYVGGLGVRCLPGAARLATVGRAVDGAGWLVLIGTCFRPAPRMKRVGIIVRSIYTSAVRIWAYRTRRLRQFSLFLDKIKKLPGFGRGWLALAQKRSIYNRREEALPPPCRVDVSRRNCFGLSNFGVLALCGACASFCCLVFLRLFA